MKQRGLEKLSIKLLLIVITYNLVSCTSNKTGGGQFGELFTHQNENTTNEKVVVDETQQMVLTLDSLVRNRNLDMCCTRGAIH